MKHNDHRQENAKRILKQAGYKRGGAVEPKVEKAAKKKSGGYVDGGAPKDRIDKPTRKATPVALARGGAAKGKGKTQVNVIVAGGHGQGAPAPVPPRPPMPPMGGPPPGGPPAPGMMNRGGKVKMTAGAGGGEGRLEKARAYGAKPHKRGGSC